ncbi:hypothetical protein Tco_1222214 [Tanacetum coccineum]
MPEIVITSRYVVPTGRVKVPAGRYVVLTGKDNVIVSAGRSKVIPACRKSMLDDIIVGSTMKALKPDGIFISQDKYVQDMLKKFDMESVRTATTPYEASKPKSKDEPDDVVNVHLYRSMIGSLMYLTASRPDIMFAVSACSRHQVTPLTSNLNHDSDYAGSHGDRKSTTGGCQFLGRRSLDSKPIAVRGSIYEHKFFSLIIRVPSALIPTGWLSVSSGGARVPTGSFTGSYWLTTSYWYALTHDPIIFDSLVKQFWSTASLRAPELGPPANLATIDRTPYTITEDTVRSQLQLGDDRGKLTFYKNKFLPQWRFLVHTIQHCLSTKTGSWDQFGSLLAIALICLSHGRRFLQIILGIETRNTKQYHVLKLSSKLFANMRLNFVGDHIPLLDAMLPPAQAAIADEGIGEAAPDVPQTIPATIQETRPEPDQSQEPLPTLLRPTTSAHIPPVFDQGHTSDPNIASFSGAHASDHDLFTSTSVEDETLGGSFHTTPPSPLQFPLWKVSILETELKVHKLLFKDVVPKLVKRVKALEVKLITKKRKVVLSDSDQEDGRAPNADLDALNALANAAVTVDSTKSPGGPSKKSHACSYDPTSDVPTTEVPFTEFPTNVPSDGAPTGPSTISPSSIIVPTSSSVPTAATIPASGGTTSEPPSSHVRDARKGKGVAVEEPTPTHDKTFKQLEEERLGWEAAQRLQAQELADFEKQRAESLMKDANLARQMSQDFEMTEDQRKRQQEVLASAANYSDAAWDIILARLQANPDLSSTIFGVEFTDDDFAARMVALVNTRRKELAEQRAQERRERPMTPSQLRQYMRTYVKNQGPAVYSTGWTMAQVRKLSPEQLQEEFDKIQRAVAFTRGLKRDGSPMTSASSKKLKTGDDEVNVEAPSNIASTTQHTASSLKKVGTKKKRLGRKGVHTSQSTIPIEEGDPGAKHKVWIKYASDADSASDDDTPINLYIVVDWELFPTGLGSINAFYKLDNSHKYFTSLREILYLVTRADLMIIYGRVMTFYQDKKAAGAGLVLWGDLKVLMDSPEVNDGSDVWKNQHTWSIQSWKLYSFSGVHVLEMVSGLVLYMFVDKNYPLSVNLIERMFDHWNG